MLETKLLDLLEANFRAGQSPTSRILRCDLAGLTGCFSATFGMRKTKQPVRRARLQPLETGQIWRMAESNLQVGLVGKLLVHYKLARHNAVRIPNSVGGKTTIEKFLKKNKAVLVKA
jgi:hypothetical protein